jgi:hypothetical protein
MLEPGEAVDELVNQCRLDGVFDDRVSVARYSLDVLGDRARIHRSRLTPPRTTLPSMPADLELVRRLGEATSWLAVVAVARADETVHASVVNAGLLDDAGSAVVAFVARGDARKLDHIGARGNATVVFRDGWQWAAVEGQARIAGNDPELLRAVFRAAGGTHSDWDEYDRVMAAEQRVAVFVTARRVVSNG